jgi:malonyl-CoA/methylmalonyl-CoA synthetase
VIGVEDEIWGESVAAVVSLRDGANLEFADLKQWCDGRMSAYKIPKQLKILDALPRNAMGKVTKPTLKEIIEW